MTRKSGVEPVRLDPDKIVAAALVVAERQGVAGMTLRMVGAELGADPTAIYRHFASKDALVVAIAERLFAGILEDEIPRSWRARMVWLARSGRDLYRAHPTIVETLATHPEESHALAKLNEIGLGALRDAGLDDAEAGRFHEVFVSYIVGTGVNEAAWKGSPAAGREAARRWYAALDPADFPNSVAVAESLFPPPDEVFDLALDVLLDAVAVAGKRHRSRAKSTSPTTRNRT